MRLMIKRAAPGAAPIQPTRFIAGAEAPSLKIVDVKGYAFLERAGRLSPMKDSPH